MPRIVIEISFRCTGAARGRFAAALMSRAIDDGSRSAASSAADDEAQGGRRCPDTETAVNAGDHANVSSQGSPSASPAAAAAEAGEGGTSSHDRQLEAEVEALRARLGEVRALQMPRFIT